MSFDPFGTQLPPQDQPSQPHRPVLNREPDPREYEMRISNARNLLLAPAILLMIVAILNVLLGGYMVVNALFMQSISEEQFRELARKSNPNFAKQEAELKAAGYDLGTIKRIGEGGCHGIGWPGIVLAPVLIFGAVRMIQVRGYGMAVFSSVVAMIPCISMSACCCLGEGVGLWALIVLMQASVREAFR